MALTDGLVSAIRAAPELESSPSLAVPVAQTQDPPGNAQATVATTQAAAATTAASHHSSGLLGSIGDFFKRDIAAPVGQALNIASAPLREVQHVYRYVRDVYAHHGVAAGLLETLGIAAGATAGGTVGGGEGAKLGGELAGSIEARTMYRDSFARTANGENYRDPDHPDWGQVSIGRDIMHLAQGAGVPGLQRKGQSESGLFSFGSGALDAVADFQLDPLANLGKMRAGVTGEGVGGQLGQRYPGLVATNGEDVARAYVAPGNGAFRRAVSDIADTSSPADIALRYKTLANKAPAGMMRALAQADTPEAVVGVLKQAADANSLLSSRMPFMTLSRVPFTKLAEGLRAADDGTLTGNVADFYSKLKRPFTLVPTAYDPNLQRLTKDFSLGDDLGAQGLYQTFRMGQSDRVSRDLLNEYLNTTDPGKRLTIFRNGLLQAVVSRAGVDGEQLADPAYLADLRGRIEDMTGGHNPGRNAVMGVGMDGANLSGLPAEGGVGQVSAAITDDQIGRVTLPDYTGFKRVAKELEGGQQVLGKADDFLYNHVTMPFKRLALTSLGFAQRISASELIPNMLRNGVLHTVANTLDSNMARLGWETESASALRKAADALVADLPEGSSGPVSDHAAQLFAEAQKTEPGIIGRAVYRMADRLGVTKTADVEDLTKMYAFHGAGTSPGVDAGHHISSEVLGEAEKAHYDVRYARLQVPAKMRPGDDFGLFGQEDRNYLDHWTNSLRRIAEDPKSQAAAKAYLAAAQAGADSTEAFAKGAGAATDWLDAQSEGHLRLYARHTTSGTDGLTPHEDWGRVSMENVRGATHAPDGTPHIPVLSAVADGTVPDAGTLGAIEQVDRPLQVAGRQFLPVMAPNMLARISNAGFQRVLDPIVNHMAREPVYATEWLTEYNRLKPAVEGGMLEDGAAVALASDRATQKMTPFIHNTMERTQFNETARNFTPFLFAQMQAYRRAGRLLAEDPGAFRQYQLAMTSLAPIGQTTTDANGKPLLMYPALGFLSPAVINGLASFGAPVVGGVPYGFSGNVSSLNTVFPFAEDPFPWHKVGPVVGVPMHIVEWFDPKAQPLATAAVGQQAAQGGVMQQLMPNTALRHAFNAATALAGWDTNKEVASAQIQTMQAMAYHDSQDPSVKAWQAKQDAGQDPGSYPGLLPPAAETDPHVRQQFLDRLRNQTAINIGLRAFLAAVLPAAPTPQVGDLGLKAELASLIKKEGFHQAAVDFVKAHPDATPYTVTQSTSSTGGALPATQVAENFMNSHAGLVSKFPYGAPWLVPQSGTYDPTVYNEQLAQGFRQRKTPTQFLDSLYVAAGNHVYYDQALPAFKAAQKAPPNGMDPSTLRRDFTTWTQQFGLAHPVWFEDFSSKNRTVVREEAAKQIADLLASGSAPNTPETAKLVSINADYQQYKAAKLARALPAAELKTDWQNYIDNLAKTDAQLAPVARSVYRDL